MAVQNFGSGGGGFQLSPGVNISEIDLTTIVPQVSTTVGAFAGAFRWGPIGERVLISSENDLVATFGRPTSDNAETWFTAANFLSYSNALYISRAGSSTIYSAIANSTGTSVNAANSATTFKNRDDYDAKANSTNLTNVMFVAKYPGAIGNSLKISVVDNANAFSSSITLSGTDVTGNAVTGAITLAVGSNTANVVFANGAGVTTANVLFVANSVQTNASFATIGDYIEVGNTTIGKQLLKVTSIGSISNTANASGQFAWFSISLDQPLKLSAATTANTIERRWEYFNQVSAAPGQSVWQGIYGNSSARDEMHIVVVDAAGKFTASPGAILEVYSGLSRATDAKLTDGSTNYWKNVINERSAYVWAGSDRSTAASNTGATLTSATSANVMTLNFQGGTDVTEANLSMVDLASALDLFVSPEDVDISLVLGGRSSGGTNGTQIANYIIDNIAEVRKDVVAFISPEQSDVVNAGVSAADNVVAFRNSLRSTSYAVLDSGYKYQYDKYNDVYRWIPLNGDIAGLCVRTDAVRDPWYSPAGSNRGQVKNAVKLAFNPNRAQRDLLYKNGVNPVITEPGQGTLLFGDKTLLARPSAFDRINVRRLFIVLEKAISRAAKSFLFEFNDEFTRAQFRNIVEPYLRDIQGRRGIYDFKVVCDDTNNTPEVIDANRFVGDIYIKPARSINYIQLNFVAVRSGIEFSEIVG